MEFTRQIAPRFLTKYQARHLYIVLALIFAHQIPFKAAVLKIVIILSPAFESFCTVQKTEEQHLANSIIFLIFTSIANLIYAKVKKYFLAGSENIRDLALNNFGLLYLSCITKKVVNV